MRNKTKRKRLENEVRSCYCPLLRLDILRNAFERSVSETLACVYSSNLSSLEISLPRISPLVQPLVPQLGKLHSVSRNNSVYPGTTRPKRREIIFLFAGSLQHGISMIKAEWNSRNLADFIVLVRFRYRWRELWMLESALGILFPLFFPSLSRFNSEIFEKVLFPRIFIADNVISRVISCIAHKSHISFRSRILQRCFRGRFCFAR